MKMLLTMARKYHAVPIIILVVVLNSVWHAIEIVIASYWSQMFTNLNVLTVSTLVGLDLIAAVLAASFSTTKAKAVSRINLDYQSDLYRTVLNISMGDMETFKLSDLTTAISGARDVVQNLVELPTMFVSSAVSAATATVILLKCHPTLTLGILLEIVPFGLFFYWRKTKLEKLNKERHKANKKLNATINRILTFLPMKSFSKEQEEFDKFVEVATAFKKSDDDRIVSVNIMWTSSRMYFIIMNVTFLVYGLITHDMATVILFAMTADKIGGVVIDVVFQLEKYTILKTHYENNQEILNMVSEPDGEIMLSNFSDSIVFEDVSFKYEDSDWVLNDININITKGMKVGIYGNSGSGKSTMMNLLMRFNDSTKGRILVDGIDITDLTKKSLRRHIGIVNQEVQLFSDMTVKENIAYGMPGCTDAQIIEAAKKAFAHDFITKLPNGYDSMIGNNGVKLSGGEAQRISIARLFLWNPDVIILDEATSKLDNVSERTVKKAIDELSKDKTVIAIAHRLTTIEDYDLLIGIKEHRISETGTSKSLLDDKNSLFYKLYTQEEEES